MMTNIAVLASMDILNVQTYADQKNVVDKYGYTERLEYANQNSVVVKY